MGATIAGILGFLGSCACFCKYTPGARELGKERVSFSGPIADCPIWVLQLQIFSYSCRRL